MTIHSCRRRLFQHSALCGAWLACAMAGGAPPDPTPASVSRDARIEQRVGELLPADLALADEHGRAVRLGDYFGTKPLILVLAYYTCPNLCPQTFRHLVQALNGAGLDVGKDFQVVAVSFDARDGPAAARSFKAEFVRGYRTAGREGGWHFLTAAPDSIDRLKEAVGFHCSFDTAHNCFAHAAGVMVVTPQGRLAHYFYGIDYAPAFIEASLKEAGAGQTSRVAEPEQQYCFAYDPRAARSSRVVMDVLRVAGAAWVVAVLSFIGLSLLRERRGSRGGALAGSGPAKGRRRWT